jgi:hypothetical protein
LGSGELFSDRIVSEDTMLPWDSYRDVICEHARDHHFVPSAWIGVAALAALLVLFA